MNTFCKLAATAMAAALILPVFAKPASAHPGHDPFEVLEKKTGGKKAPEAGHDPVIFSSIEHIEQSSSLELWAGLQFKAYYHLTISGKRNQGKEAISRTFTFEVANSRKDIIRRNRGFEARGGLSAKGFSRQMAGCHELAQKAKKNPERYNFRVQNRGRARAACRLIVRKPKIKTIPGRLAKRKMASNRDAV